MNKIVGRGSKKEYVFEGDTHTHVNELNSFYSRFDVHDFKEEINTIKTSLNHKEDETIFEISEKEVKKSFDRLKINKSSGPDGVKSNVPKMCSLQLSTIYSFIFNLSIKESSIPSSWKCSEIIPVPKKIMSVRLTTFGLLL